MTLQKWCIVQPDGVEIKQLKTGTYTLKETKVPAGYAKAPDQTFTVTDTSELQTVVMTDPFTVTTFRKLSAADHDQFVKGASLELRSEKDDPNSVITTITGEKVRWISGTSEKVFKGIPAGTYWLVETAPPSGYSIAEPVEVVIKASIDNVAEMYDAPFADLTVVKKIKASDINFANGNPTFIITVKGTDTSGILHEYNEYFEFTEAYVKQHTDSEGYVSISHTWKSIAISKAYKVTETGHNRYYLSLAESKDDNVSIKKNGTASYGNTPEDSYDILVDLQEKSTGTSITFTNSKHAWKGWGHNTVVKNRINSR